jgi:hypothetical protein
MGTAKYIIDEDEHSKPRRELVREMETLRAENRTLHDDLSQKIIVLQKYENELKRYRSLTFLGENYLGAKRYSEELFEFLRSGGLWTAIDSSKT